jgi:CDGSH-type Zn-finger protein
MSGAEKETSVTLYEDGPLLVRGPFVLRAQDGSEIDRGRQTVALCRCGKSGLKPFCDGTHKLIDFRAAGSAGSAPRDLS